MKRRDFVFSSMLGGGGYLAATQRVHASSINENVGGPSKVASDFLMMSPVEQFKQLMRVQRSILDEDDILHWYHFTMVAVPADAVPIPVVRWEGIEFSRHERIGDTVYRLHGHNLSFPRDLHSGEFVDRVRNPVTRQVVDVPPMALTEDPGIVRSLEGVVTLDAPGAKPRPELRVIRRENDWIKVDAIRVPPETWPVTFLEMGTEATPVSLYNDPDNLWLPSEVSGAYVFPWPKWMQMGEIPGHMFATWSGCKLRTVDALPSEFIRRAEQGYAHLLHVDRTPFSQPLPI
jgi:hypothetical protein